MILVVAAVCIAGMWKVFVKAGQPGWAVLVPFYNLYLMLKIVGRPAWWILLFLIPFVSLVIVVIFAMDMAKSFGKSAGWGIVMLLLLGGIGYLVLGFGDARYVGPAAADGAAVPATA
ncbi:MAG: signal peptidase I [Acidobacteriia bacterium]|nr:signal peptidase I [Terriglobia bacterium]